MQAAALSVLPDVAPRLALGPSGTQFLPVSGYVTDRLFVTYRAPAADLAPLVPAPFVLDAYAGFGFVSVCAVEILGMGIHGTPAFLRFDSREFLYRLAVRFGGESTFLTLRSDVSSRALAVLGRYFSHYRPRLGKVRMLRAEKRVRIECTSRDGRGDAVLDADTGVEARTSGSVFGSHDEATRFLLGMRFSADAVGGRVRVQPIDHSPWYPRFVEVNSARFTFVEELAQRLGTELTYDGTLATRGVRQVWRAARWT